MSDITPDILTQQLRWRYAVKRFDASKRLDDDVWRALETTLVLAPSSYGLQPWRFFVITDRTIKDKLPEISWNQSQPRDCSHLVVLAARRTLDEDYIDRYLESIVQHRSVPKESLGGYRRMLMASVTESEGKHLDWNSRQVYIVLGQLMTAAAMLGVDSCPMEGIDVAAYDRLLGLSDSDYSTVVACALGYRHEDDKYAAAPKVRFAANEMVEYFERR